MNRPLVAAFAASLAVSACDLPTTADEAREHLGRNQAERIIPIQLPMPEISVTLADQLGALSGIVDTTDLSFSITPDTFAFGLDTLLAIDPVDPDPVTQGYDLAVADFTREIDVEIPAVPIALPSDMFQFSLAPLPGGGTVPVPIDLSASFDIATFAAGSAFEIEVTMDETASLDGLTAEIQSGGETLATSSGAPLTVASSATDTLTIDLTGVELPGNFDLVLMFDAASGDGSGDNLQVDIRFTDAEVTGATGVDASTITAVSFNQAVALDQAGADFSEATLSAGNAAVTSYEIGTLELTPDFSGDLAGLQIGGPNPDDLTVSGTVGPPTGSTHVDIANTASLTVAFTDLEVESVTLGSVTMAVDQTVAVETGGGTLDELTEVSIGSGFLRLEVHNRLDVTGAMTLTLNGLTDQNGDVITTTFTLQPSTGGSGTAVTTTEIVDLSNTTLDPAALEAAVSGDIAGTDVTVTPTSALDAVVIDPYLEIEPVAVVLGATPDMSVTLDQSVSLATDEIDLGQLGDILDKVSFNDVAFTVTVGNGTGLDVEIANFGMTLLDATGAPVTDAEGGEVTVALSNNEAGTLVEAPADSTTVVSADAAVFVNSLLDALAGSEDVSVAVRGSMGPSSGGGVIALGDSISVVFEIALGPDITVDPTGITLDQVMHEALQLDSTAADFMANLSEDLVSASVEFEAVNGMPLGFSLSMAIAPTPGDTTGFDPFTATNNILLPAVTIGAADVDAEGRASSPTVSVDSATVNPADFGVLEGTLSVGISAAVLGPPGDRAQLQPTDSLVLRPLLKIEVRVNGSGGNE